MSLVAGGANHAFVSYSGGAAADLNDLIPAGSGWILNFARGINNAGQIVGFGTSNGEQHAFLLTPNTGPRNLVWTPQAGSNVWDHTIANWLNTDTNQITTFADGDFVTFANQADPSAAHTILIEAGGVSPNSISVNSSQAYTIGGGAIDGSGGITKSGTAALTLQGSNSFTGTTAINQGQVLLGDNGALGTFDGPTVVNAGATLNLNGRSIAEPLVLSGTLTTAVNTSASVSGQITLNNTPQVLTTSTSTLISLSGYVTGPGSLRNAGVGTLVLSNSSNDYVGGTLMISSQAILRATASNVLGSGPIQITGANAGTLQLVSTAPITLPNALILPPSNGFAALVVDDGTPGSGGMDAEVTHVISGPVTIAGINPGFTTIPARLRFGSFNGYNLRFTGAVTNNGEIAIGSSDRLDIAGPYSSPDPSTHGSLIWVASTSVDNSATYSIAGIHITNNLPTSIEDIAGHGLIIDNGPMAPVTLTGQWKADGSNSCTLAMRNGGKFLFADSANIDTRDDSGATRQFRIFGDIGGGGTVEFAGGFKADPTAAANDEFVNLHLTSINPSGGPLTVITNSSQSLPVSDIDFDSGVNNGATWSIRGNDQSYAGTVKVALSSIIETQQNLTLTNTTSSRLTVSAGRKLTVTNGGDNGELILAPNVGITTIAGSLAVIGTVDRTNNDLIIQQTLSGIGSILSTGALNTRTTVTGALGVLNPGENNGSGIGSLAVAGLTVASSASFAAELEATNDQVIVTGTNSTPVIITDSTLSLSGTAPNSSYILINNATADPVTGTFANLPEDANVTVNGQSFRITYRGGDGNDVALIPPNAAPVAADDQFTTDEDQAVSGNVLTNDSDADGNTLTAVLDGGPAHGSLLFNPDGSFTYTPAADYVGFDSFTYHANDGEDDSNIATVSLTIEPRFAIAGSVYEDRNDNGIKEAEEPGVGGVEVTLSGNNDLGSITPITVFTQPDGSYQFSGLRAGTYTVSEAQPNGYLDGLETSDNMTPLANSGGGPDSINVVLSADSLNDNFGELRPAAISGCVYLDINQDGIRETPMALLGTAARYGIFGINGGNVILNSAHITGDVALGPNETASTLQKTDITGTLTTDPSATWDKSNLNKDFSISGGYGTQSLAQAADDANSASASFATMTPTQNLGNITASTTIVGNGGTNVISLASLNFNAQTLTLRGTANDIFIINVTGGFSFYQSTIALQGGVLPSNIVFNFPTAGTTIDLSKSTNVIYGTFLAPHRSLIYHNPAYFDGQIIAQNIDLHSDANIKSTFEGCIANVVINLTGTDDLGQAVSLSTTTSTSGYFFGGLRPGTYTLSIVQPSGYVTGFVSSGTVDGVTDGQSSGTASIINIVLKSGSLGTNYDFAEFLA
jgi:probable HAF family extracellular repeat protein/autotransporter-associated beta strand protein